RNSCSSWRPGPGRRPANKQGVVPAGKGQRNWGSTGLLVRSSPVVFSTLFRLSIQGSYAETHGSKPIIPAPAYALQVLAPNGQLVVGVPVCLIVGVGIGLVGQPADFHILTIAVVAPRLQAVLVMVDRGDDLKVSGLATPPAEVSRERHIARVVRGPGN